MLLFWGCGGFFLLARHCLLGVGKHQLDAVFLIDLRGAGIVVDGNDIDCGDLFFNGLHHALAANVVGQASKGLGANNVVHAVVGKLQHFGVYMDAVGIHAEKRKFKRCCFAKNMR